LVAPLLTAIGAIAALANEWSIEVEHHEPPVETTTEVEATRHGDNG